MRLNDKAILITGAGGGIGQASALTFAREGAKLIINDLALAAAERTAELVREAGGEACAFAADVRDEEQVIAMVRFTLQQFGRIDALFNNAGIGYSAQSQLNLVMDTVVKTPAKDWDEILSINLRSVFLCCKYVLPHMIENGGGVILNCSSINGVIGCGADAYSASKGGILALTRALAVENAKHSVRVNAVSPAATDTPMIQPAYATKGFYEYWSSAPPMKRMATAQDVANAALFFLSDESAYITGQNLMVDGGLSVS
ncbi:MAG: SDR family oxidoreductase [Candidatus Limiplasma sp.]|nr:SDR family oxidoreductase [Candidatus Limiplasma sp.]